MELRSLAGLGTIHMLKTQRKWTYHWGAKPQHQGGKQGKPKTLPHTHKATDKACEKFQTKPKENAYKFKMKHACKI